MSIGALRVESLELRVERREGAVTSYGLRVASWEGKGASGAVQLGR